MHEHLSQQISVTFHRLLTISHGEYQAWRVVKLVIQNHFTLLQDADQAQQVHRRDRMPLHHFLRLIGGGRIIERDAAATNDELVSALKRRGIITQ